ncbi:MAG: hypothetical protein QOC78_2957 [Solirubrobacteraceae bacterium]|nr:hypothetical protein [Solirubrobacteraceae bacterium]
MPAHPENVLSPRPAGVLPAILVGRVAGAATGVFNGIHVAYGTLPPLIVVVMSTSDHCQGRRSRSA